MRDGMYSAVPWIWGSKDMGECHCNNLPWSWILRYGVLRLSDEIPKVPEICKPSLGEDYQTPYIVSCIRPLRGHSKTIGKIHAICAAAFHARLG